MIWIDLSDRRSVRRFHVVGIDFKFRLRIDFGALAQDQIIIELGRVRLLRDLMDVNSPVKDAARFVVQYAFVKLRTRRVRRLRVQHCGRMIDVTFAINQVQTIENDFGTRLGQLN